MYKINIYLQTYKYITTDIIITLHINTYTVTCTKLIYIYRHTNI